MRAALILLCLGGVASADPVDDLQKAVPSGWTVLATDHELVLRHDRPCYSTGSKTGNVCGGADGPMVTLELRFKVEPKWTQAQIDAARAANDKLTDERKAAREKFRIDAIHADHGVAKPANADEKKRLSAFEKADEKLRAREVHTPMCTWGEHAILDSDEVYAVLKMKVDPQSASTEAHQALDALKKACGAS